MVSPENISSPSSVSSTVKMRKNRSMGILAKKKPSISRQWSIVKAEARAEGQVKSVYYLRYFESWGPLFFMPIFVLLITGLERGVAQIQNWWLSVSFRFFASLDDTPLFFLATY
jgi:hypothetical protein